MKETIVLGLSGGVDSAVTASLLKQDYHVHGVYLDIGLGGSGKADATAVAEKLGIEFEVVDIKDALEHHVCAPFVQQYLEGKTPLPCAMCNPTVKFPALFQVADRIGATKVATGHYARIEDGLLKKGLSRNDQSYLLSRLTKEQIARIVFPLGELEKPHIRKLAEEFGIPVANKPDSMEICFIQEDDYAQWMADRGKVPPAGNFVDKNGKILGQHRGYHGYTLGQGRGLGVSGPHRYFVTELRPATNEVVLSDGSDLERSQVDFSHLNWLGNTPPVDGMEVTVRLRHSKNQSKAILTLTEDGGHLELETSARAPTPGQLAVCYDGDVVLGSGWIL